MEVFDECYWDFIDKVVELVVSVGVDILFIFILIFFIDVDFISLLLVI